jgi:hypothetical protein
MILIFNIYYNDKNQFTNNPGGIPQHSASHDEIFALDHVFGVFVFNMTFEVVDRNVWGLRSENQAFTLF